MNTYMSIEYKYLYKTRGKNKYLDNIFVRRVSRVLKNAFKKIAIL